MMSEWAKNNRDKINKNNRNWRQKHKKQFNEIVKKRRKQVAEELKAKGMMFAYMPRTERERRSINFICRKLKVNEDEARRILIDNEWNIKKILAEHS